MKWSWRVMKLFGIDIKIHLTFIFALAWGGFLWSDGSLGSVLYGVFLTLVLFGVVVLHELGHSLAAQRYGITVHDIVLLPIGGVARLGRMPEKPVQELWVALAGPAVNLALIIITAPILVGGLALRPLLGLPMQAGLPNVTSPGWLNFVAFLVMVNVSLLLFNMLPAFPMDGGRALRALLAMKLSYRRATSVAVAGGRLFALLFGVIGILTANIFLTVVALFIFGGAGAEAQEQREPSATPATSGEALAGAAHTAPAPAAHVPVLLADTPAHLAFDRLLRSPYPVLAVVDDGGQFVGVVTRTSMERRWAAGVRGPVSLFVER